MHEFYFTIGTAAPVHLVQLIKMSRTSLS